MAPEGRRSEVERPGGRMRFHSTEFVEAVTTLSRKRATLAVELVRRLVAPAPPQSNVAGGSGPWRPAPIVSVNFPSIEVVVVMDARAVGMATDAVHRAAGNQVLYRAVNERIAELTGQSAEPGVKLFVC